MQTWFLIALSAPFVHSIANFIDKILLSKYFKDFSLFVLIIYTAFTSIITLPVFLIFGGLGILKIPLGDIFLLIIAGLCAASAIYFYLYALYREDASVVVPFFQLIPVFSFVLGRFILGEMLSTRQLLASLVVIFGAALLSIEIEEGRKIRFRRHVVLSMIVMSILIALGGILFKFVATEESFWLSNFWEGVGFALFGVLVFISKRKDRKDFYQSLKLHKFKITAFVLLSEVFTLGGNVLLNYAFLLAPVVLVRVVEGYQPIFVLVFGILITKMFPHILQEKIGWKHLLPKILAILIIFVGSCILLY